MIIHMSLVKYMSTLDDNKSCLSIISPRTSPQVNIRNKSRVYRTKKEKILFKVLMALAFIVNNYTF